LILVRFLKLKREMILRPKKKLFERTNLIIHHFSQGQKCDLRFRFENGDENA